MRQAHSDKSLSERLFTFFTLKYYHFCALTRPVLQVADILVAVVVFDTAAAELVFDIAVAVDTPVVVAAADTPVAVADSKWRGVVVVIVNQGSSKCCRYLRHVSVQSCSQLRRWDSLFFFGEIRKSCSVYNYKLCLCMSMYGIYLGSPRTAYCHHKQSSPPLELDTGMEMARGN